MNKRARIEGTSKVFLYWVFWTDIEWTVKPLKRCHVKTFSIFPASGHILFKNISVREQFNHGFPNPTSVLFHSMTYLYLLWKHSMHENGCAELYMAFCLKQLPKSKFTLPLCHFQSWSSLILSEEWMSRCLLRDKNLVLSNARVDKCKLTTLQGF